MTQTQNKKVMRFAYPADYVKTDEVVVSFRDIESPLVQMKPTPRGPGRTGGSHSFLITDNEPIPMPSDLPGNTLLLCL